MKSLLIILLLVEGAFGQDFHSSNLQNISLLYNPALAAINNQIEANVNYRSQWSKAGTPFKTFGVSIASSLQPKKTDKKSYLAIGGQLYEQRIGNQSSNLSFSVSPTYHLKFTKHTKLSVGLNLGLYQIKKNIESGTWEQQHNGLFYDPTLPSGENLNRQVINSFDAGFGSVFSIKNKNQKIDVFQLGIAMYHINKPLISNLSNGTKLPVRTTVFSSIAIPLGRRGSYIESKLLYQNQGEFNSFAIGATAKVKLIEHAKSTSSISKLNELYAGLGIYVRNKDALIINAILQKSTWSVTLAYDMTVSNFKRANQSLGSIELSLYFNIKSFSRKSHY